MVSSLMFFLEVRHSGANFNAGSRKNLAESVLEFEVPAKSAVSFLGVVR